MKWLAMGLVVLGLVLSALVGKMAAWQQIALEAQQGLMILPQAKSVSGISLPVLAGEAPSNTFAQAAKQPLPRVIPAMSLSDTKTEPSFAPEVSTSQKETHLQPQEGEWLVLPDSAARLIRVDIGKQRVYVFENGQLKFAFKCSTSETGILLPPGVDSDKPHDHIGLFAVQSKELNHFSRKYRVDMPYALRYYNGHYIHATHEIGRLGRPASHGCVRLHPLNAKTLYGFIRIGDSIEIR